MKQSNETMKWSLIITMYKTIIENTCNVSNRQRVAYVECFLTVVIHLYIIAHLTSYRAINMYRLERRLKKVLS